MSSSSSSSSSKSNNKIIVCSVSKREEKLSKILKYSFCFMSIFHRHLHFETTTTTTKTTTLVVKATMKGSTTSSSPRRRRRRRRRRRERVLRKKRVFRWGGFLERGERDRRVREEDCGSQRSRRPGVERRKNSKFRDEEKEEDAFEAIVKKSEQISREVRNAGRTPGEMDRAFNGGGFKVSRGENKWS